MAVVNMVTTVDRSASVSSVVVTLQLMRKAVIELDNWVAWGGTVHARSGPETSLSLKPFRG